MKIKLKTFVNFPRREMECYKIFKKLIKNKSNLNMHVNKVIGVCLQIPCILWIYLIILQMKS